VSTKRADFAVVRRAVVHSRVRESPAVAPGFDVSGWFLPQSFPQLWKTLWKSGDRGGLHRQHAVFSCSFVLLRAEMTISSCLFRVVFYIER